MFPTKSPKLHNLEQVSQSLLTMGHNWRLGVDSPVSWHCYLPLEPVTPQGILCSLCCLARNTKDISTQRRWAEADSYVPTKSCYFLKISVLRRSGRGSFSKMAYAHPVEALWYEQGLWASLETCRIIPSPGPSSSIRDRQQMQLEFCKVTGLNDWTYWSQMHTPAASLQGQFNASQIPTHLHAVYTRI